MANTILLKNSVTAASVPTQLEKGEFAVNIADKKVWVGDAAKNPVLLFGGSANESFLGTVAGGVLTKTSGTLVVTRISEGVYDITAPADMALIVNLPDDMIWGEASNPPPTKRRINIRHSEVLGRPLKDPTTLLIMGIA